MGTESILHICIFTARKLREGNVILGVRQSFCSQGYQVPSWGYVQERSGYVQGWVPPPPDMGPGIPQNTVGKRVVRILLECFLVLPLLLLFSKTQTQMLTLSVNGPLQRARVDVF